MSLLENKDGMCYAFATCKDIYFRFSLRCNNSFENHVKAF
jgi:hypothetical protein